jgi:nitroreductase
MNKKEILDAYIYRHACKEFDPSKKISSEDFDFILETIRLSPSSFGLEPWKFLIIQNQTDREKFLANTWGGQKQIPTSSHFIACLARKKHFMKYDTEYIKNFMKNIQKNSDEVLAVRGEFYKNFQISDQDMVNDERALFDWACKQCYIALGNSMTAAAMVGIDSCPIEGFHKKKLEQVLEQNFKVNLDHFGLVYMVCFGYRINPPKDKTRQTIDQITEWIK